MSRVLTSIAAFLLIGCQSFAEERRLGEREIQDLLNNAEVLAADESWRQTFDPGGETLYLSKGSRPSFGRWRVRAPGAYCSLWPPQDVWTCYSVDYDVDSGRITWTASNGDPSVGYLVSD